jgi:dTDP-4-dehydrorhamnose 3,5-epimerase
MTVIETGIEGLLLLEPKVFGDHRGYFFESFRQDTFNEVVGQEIRFVQDNESMSGTDVLRGLHFQKPPFAQGKLVRVVSGKVLDVALDIRRSSKTYGKYFAIELNPQNKLQLWIPPGFAHGFVSLEEGTIFQYKCTEYYSPDNEGCILWNDPFLSIDWRIDNPKISEKDKNGVIFQNFSTPFE